MDTFSIPGPPCPICGENAFAWEVSDAPLQDFVVEVGDAFYHPRVCAECGNIQLVLTRADALDACGTVES